MEDSRATDVNLTAPFSPRSGAAPAPLPDARSTYATMRAYVEPLLTALEPVEIATRGQVSLWRSLLPWPVTVIAADTNTVAANCVRLARTPSMPPRLITVLGSSTAAVLLGAHVPGEMRGAIDRIAEDNLLAADARAVWTDIVGPRTRVVDLPIGEYMRPEIQAVAIGEGLRADPDDLPLAALAAFVPDAVIWSNDGIFSRVGLRLGDSPEISQAMATLAVSEHLLALYAQSAWFSGRATVAAGSALVSGAGRRPALALAVTALGAVLALATPQRTRERTRGFASALSRAAACAEGLGEIAAVRRTSAADLLTYQTPSWRTRTLEEGCAGLLARAAAPITAAELAIKLPFAYPDVDEDDVTTRLRAHSAFAYVEGEGWMLGRPAIERSA